MPDPNLGDIVIGFITDVDENGVWLDVDGVVGLADVRELPLTHGEVPADRYSVGDHLSARVWFVDHDAGHLSLSIRRTNRGYDEALTGFKVGDIVTGSVTEVDEEEGIWLDVDGVVGLADVRELLLADGEVPAVRYSVGDQISVRIWIVHHDAGHLSLSVRRAARGYDEAFVAFKVGEIVTGSVTEVCENGIWLDVDGVVGLADALDLPLADGEVPADRYSVGDHLSVRVCLLNHDGCDLALSVRRATPGYDETLAHFEVGDIVTCSVTYVGPTSLHLDVDGVVGLADMRELPLADGEVPADRYSVKDQISARVWIVDHDAGRLSLSVRRAAPGYDETLAAFEVGDVVTGSVTCVFPIGLDLDVDGVAGLVAGRELPLADGEVPADRYSVGDQLTARIWIVDHDAGSLNLSVRRATRVYDEALATFEVGDIVTGSVTDIGSGGLALDVDGAIGFIYEFELHLAEGKVLADSYFIGQSIEALLWDIDHARGHLALSVRRLTSGFAETPSPVGTQLDAIVQSTLLGGIRVQTAYGGAFIPDYALSLSIGDRPRFKIGQRIPVIVVAVDDDGKPTTLSYRRALDGWERTAKRFEPGTIIQDAQVIPGPALPEDERRLALDLGPITGFISERERDHKTTQEIREYSSNTEYPVVVETLDKESRFAIVSNAKFHTRWQELAKQFNIGHEVNVKVRRVDRKTDMAFCDLGYNLTGQLPLSQIINRDGPNNKIDNLINETFTVAINSIDSNNYHISLNRHNYELARLISQGESPTLEFKHVFKGKKPDSSNPKHKQHEVYSGLPVFRAIAGMMNSNGGKVLIGIIDPKNSNKKDGKPEIVGWQDSQFKTKDTMVTRLGNMIHDKLSAIAGSLYVSKFEMLPDGNEILVITCKPSRSPIMLKMSKDKPAEFRVRRDASTELLDGDKMVDYFERHFYSLYD